MPRQHTDCRTVSSPGLSIAQDIHLWKWILQSELPHKFLDLAKINCRCNAADCVSYFTLEHYISMIQVAIYKSLFCASLNHQTTRKVLTEHVVIHYLYTSLNIAKAIINIKASICNNPTL